MILCLCLMNMGRTTAANLSGDSVKGGGESFYGELRGDRTFSVADRVVSWCVVLAQQHRERVGTSSQDFRAVI